MPDFAIGEIESLVLKAYRGAGFSWGMSQEAGRVAGWMANRHLPALDAFAVLLRQTDEVPHDQLAPDIRSADWPNLWGNQSNLLCPVVTGVLLSDLAWGELPATVRFRSVASPIVLISYLSEFVSAPAVLSFGSCRFDIPSSVNTQILLCKLLRECFEDSSLYCLVDKDDVLLETVDVGIDSESAPRSVAVSAEFSNEETFLAQRGTGSADSVEFLQRLAHRTYVPSTQASRASGAGAGFSDND